MDITSLHRISYGVYIVTSGSENRCNGQIANSVVQVSANPPLVAVSINKNNYTHELIKKNRIFAVSVLSEETPLSFIGNFGFKCGKEFDKFENTNYQIGVTGTRIILDYSIAYFEVKVQEDIDATTHTIFLGEVVDGKILSGKPQMTYDFYHKIKRGTTPKSAPTFTVNQTKTENKKYQKYRCKVCGYIYDPLIGDPDSGIVPNMPFNELPLDWICPICKAKRNQFELIS